MTVAQIEPIAVIFTAPEENLPSIMQAQAIAPLKTIAITTDGKKPLADGVLSVVNNQVDTTSGTIRLKAVFDNKDHALWPGQSVSTRLLVNTLKDATLPCEAVQHGTDGSMHLRSTDNKASCASSRCKSVDAAPDRRGFARRTCYCRRPVQGAAGIGGTTVANSELPAAKAD